MFCIFCAANDLPALWAYQGLNKRGLKPLEIFTIEALVYNQSLVHRLELGETHTMIQLADGRVLDSAAVRGVLNRLSYLPTDHFRNTSPADRSYAVQEQQAVFLSWLNALPEPLINHPSPRGLAGNPRSQAEWTWLAGQAGLPVLPYDQSDRTTQGELQNVPGVKHPLVVLDGKIFGFHPPDWPESFRDAIVRLAKLSDLHLMGIDIIQDPSNVPLFYSATPLPDLRLGGEALLDALARALIGDI